jgi:signal transduction histidine kinase/DNA-binding NarL/FixJ family response regulator
MPARPLDQKVKVLYIEDNRENRMLVRAVLEAAGYLIVDAEDGLAGIEAAIREEPALILLDINLPGVDGYEIVAILKSFPNLASTPVIAVTAYAMQGDRQRTLVAGCDGYIQKPIDVDAFPRQVAEFLGGKRERVESHDEGVYLRELNQRLVYRLLNQVEELKRLNQHFVRRASQLEDLHRSMEDITSELGVAGMLEKLLGGLARAIGSTSLSVELSEPPGVHVSVRRDTDVQPRSVLAGSGVSAADDWTEVEWRLPLTVRGRPLGVMIARHVLPPGAKADEEQLLKIVADQVAIAVENARLYEGVMRLHEETQERLRHTETLLAMSQDASATLELNEILRRTTRAMVRALGADTGGAWLQSEDGSRFVPIVGYHVPKELLGALESATLKSLDPRVSDWRRVEGPVYSSNSQEDSRFNHPIARMIPHKSVLIQPMRWKGESIGGFALAWLKDHHRFTSDELRLTEAIAQQAAVASENSRLYEAEKQQVAELKRTQAQLIQSTKLAAIGELAANIAHEINNPLTSVLGFASYLAEQVPPGQPWREELDLIQEEAGRARDIVRDLLHFSRQREFIPQVTDLNTVLEQTLAMVRRQGALESITLREEYASGLAPVEIDVPRIKQVFLNLINNAVYVMKERGGSLTIRSSANGDTVQVEVIDTGTGIAPEHIHRIFEPFFTTKPEVSGTGLGLSVSLGIVESHGGSIEVQSELGKGSTFTIKLPAKPGATIEERDPEL